VTVIQYKQAAPNGQAQLVQKVQQYENGAKKGVILAS